MGWHSTWDKPEWNNEDVKYLLADLCNAVNERISYKSDAKILWKIVGNSTTVTPAPNDFSGLVISSMEDPDTRGYYSLKQVLQQLVSAIIGLSLETPSDLRPYGYFTASDFNTLWTWDDLITSVGILTPSQVLDYENWRKRAWWNTLKQAISQLRYLETAIGLEVQNSDVVKSGNDALLILDYFLGDSITLVTQTRDETWNNEVPFVDPTTNPDDKIEAMRAVGYFAYVVYCRNAHGVFNEYDGLYGGGFLKCKSTPVLWDADYRVKIDLSDGTTNSGFGTARSFPIPEAASLGAVPIFATGRRYGQEFRKDLSPVVEWNGIYVQPSYGTLQYGGLEVDPAEEDVELELSLSGEDFVLKAADTVNFFQTNLGPSGSSVLTVVNSTPPEIVPQSDYIPTYNRDGVYNSGSQHLIRLEEMHVRYDLNPIFTYT